jgi:protein transport protein SEC24
MIMWIGGSVSPQLLLDLFGVDDLLALDAQMVGTPIYQRRTKS